MQRFRVSALDARPTHTADAAFAKLTSRSGYLAESAKLTRSSFMDVVISQCILTAIARGMDDKLDAIADVMDATRRASGSADAGFLFITPSATGMSPLPSLPDCNAE